MTFSTITTPTVLTLYRQKHTIKPVATRVDDLPFAVNVCDHDGIRVYERAGGWLHDPSQVKAYAAIERGEPFDWSIR